MHLAVQTPGTNTLKPLVLIAAGGTISIERREPAYPASAEVASRLSAAQLLAKTRLAPPLDPTRIRCLDFPYPEQRIGSVNDVLGLARAIAAEGRRGVAGIVVTHGTDTLEEVAYVVDEMGSGIVPVVFTGAMRPSWAADYDGAQNLENAVRLAACCTTDSGTLVTMNGCVFDAVGVYKQDSLALDAFAARRGFPSVCLRAGRVEASAKNALESIVQPSWTPTRWNRIGEIPDSLPHSVAIVTVGVGDDGALLGGVGKDNEANHAISPERLVESGIHGLVVASLGAGTLPPAVLDCLTRLARSGLPVVCCAGTPSGPAAADAYYPAVYGAIARAGLIFENYLSPRKARLRLMLSLGLGRTYVPVQIKPVSHKSSGIRSTTG